MSENFIPFSLPEIDEKEINEVIDTMKSGWLTTGQKCKKFELNFSEFLNSNVYSIAINSATAGLHLALEALGVKEGDEVITTPFTFTATAEVIRYLGADPIFVDIDLKNYNLDVEQIERSISDRTKVILPVHFAGYPCDMTRIIEIAKKYKLFVVEDAAHALPSYHSGSLIGSQNSDVTVFSFYANKTMTTGEGGMLVTKDKKIAERASIMRLHGINRNVFDRFTSEKPAWFYQVVAPGFKYNMTDIAGSIGIQQLKKLKHFHSRRLHLASIYDNYLKDLPIILPPRPTQKSDHSWHLYVIRLTKDINISRNKFIEEMHREGIGCSVHYIPLHLHEYWSNRYSLSKESFPIATEVFNNCISLPLYTKLKDSQIEFIIRTINNIIRKYE